MMLNIIDKFKVTRGGKPRSKALPGIIKISENHLVVAYRDASDWKDSGHFPQ